MFRLAKKGWNIYRNVGLSSMMRAVIWKLRSKSRELLPKDYSPYELLPRDPESIHRLFHNFRTESNAKFFDQLTDHFLKKRALQVHFLYAITCNERGQDIMYTLGPYVNPADKEHLDVGCAYGGVVVAFVRNDAHSTGIDIEPIYLQLAKTNLECSGVSASLRHADASDPGIVKLLARQFDIITANDVIEHVKNLEQFTENIHNLLADGGIAYLAIPNGKFPKYVVRDGHHGLFGITLLDYEHAQDYYSQYHDSKYNTFNYLTIDQWNEVFSAAGLKMEIMLESFFHSDDLKTVLNDMKSVRSNLPLYLQTVPSHLKKIVMEKLQAYITEVESARLDSKRQRRKFLLDYGVQTWQVLLRHT